MSYIADNPLLKLYLQDSQQQHMKFTHKCIMHVVFSIMQSVPYYIYVQLKINILQFNNEFISQLWIYAKAVRILAKGNLPILLVMPLKLQQIISSVKEMLIKTNPAYSIVIERWHLILQYEISYFWNRSKKKIIQFPIFVQPYTQQPLILY